MSISGSNYKIEGIKMHGIKMHPSVEFLRRLIRDKPRFKTPEGLGLAGEPIADSTDHRVSVHSLLFGLQTEWLKKNPGRQPWEAFAGEDGCFDPEFVKSIETLYPAYGKKVTMEERITWLTNRPEEISYFAWMMNEFGRVDNYTEVLKVDAPGGRPVDGWKKIPHQAFIFSRWLCIQSFRKERQSAYGKPGRYPGGLAETFVGSYAEFLVNDILGLTTRKSMLQCFHDNHRGEDVTGRSGAMRAVDWAGVVAGVEGDIATAAEYSSASRNHTLSPGTSGCVHTTLILALEHGVDMWPIAVLGGKRSLTPEDEKRLKDAVQNKGYKKVLDTLLATSNSVVGGRAVDHTPHIKVIAQEIFKDAITQRGFISLDQSERKKAVGDIMNLYTFLANEWASCVCAEAGRTHIIAVQSALEKLQTGTGQEVVNLKELIL